VQVLVFVGRTLHASGARTAADRATVTGLVLDGGKSLPFASIFVERVSGVSIRGNAIQNSSYGIFTRLASGIASGNLASTQGRPAIVVGGGSVASPASFDVTGNRVISTTNGIAIGGAPDILDTPYGANASGISFEPVQKVYDLDNPDDLRNVPNTVTVTVSGNEATGCSYANFHAAAFGPSTTSYVTVSPDQSPSSFITATVTDNVFVHSNNFGVFVGSFAPVDDPRAYEGTIDLTLARNQLDKNSEAPAFFGFGAVYVEDYSGNPKAATDKYLQHSLIRVHSDGEVTGFRFDNSATDPVLGVALDNTLIVNDLTISGSTR
jgi:hypothetical protein